MSANVRTGQRGERMLVIEECQGFSVHGRDTPNDSDEQILAFSANHLVSLLNTFFSTAKINFVVYV